MTVTPVAKHPIALRKSLVVRVMPIPVADIPVYFPLSRDGAKPRHHTSKLSTNDGDTLPQIIPSSHLGTEIGRVRYDRCQPKTGCAFRDAANSKVETMATISLNALSVERLTSDSQPISREAACCLLRANDEGLPALLAAAQAARTKFKPGVITYSRKVFLPLTNLCRDHCGYCTFRRDPGEPGAHTMTPDEVMEVVRAGERMGCTEALFSLGDKPELLFPQMRDTLRRFGYKSTLHYLEAMCEKVLRESSLLPHPNPGLMSAEWLERLSRVAPSMGLMLETTSARLLAKDAAHDNAPDK